MNTAVINNAFALDIAAGLNAAPKFISSKYFYDDNGSALFREIMKMPEYYPTRCEAEILKNQSDAICRLVAYDVPFNIIELGSGDGTKTINLLTAFLENGVAFKYIPVDISTEAISVLEKNILRSIPNIRMCARAGDYFDILDELSQEDLVPNVYLFLGGNIGNYKTSEAENLLKKFASRMNPGDKLLIGIDLQKNPRVVQRAYDDLAGITKAFNLNLLQRINSELEADFDLSAFDFYSTYNPCNGEVNSFLISLKQQDVFIAALDLKFSFGKDECIWTELSKKYTFEQIEILANTCGFAIAKNFTDSKGYFTDSLWVK